MTDRALLQQALEALERYGGVDQRACDAEEALRERLAQPDADWDWRHPKAQALIGAKARLEIKLRLVEQLVEDPNLETTASDMEYWEPLHDKLQERLAQPEQEPVAWITPKGIEYGPLGHSEPGTIQMCFPLYTTPPQRKPLTDEEIDKLPWEPHEGNPMTFAEGLRYFARAIEAAHGIKGQA